MAVQEGHALREQENKSAGERKATQAIAETSGVLPGGGGDSRNYWPPEHVAQWRERERIQRRGEEKDRKVLD